MRDDRQHEVGVAANRTRSKDSCSSGETSDFAKSARILQEICSQSCFCERCGGSNGLDAYEWLGTCTNRQGDAEHADVNWKGSTVIYCNPLVSERTSLLVKTLLQAGGSVHSVPDERLVDAVTAISGSGPAYVFHLVEALAAAGQQVGLAKDLSLALAKETVYGAGALAMSSSKLPGELRKSVTSPNGTTAAALSVLMNGDALVQLIAHAVSAAHLRAVELGGPSKSA